MKKAILALLGFVILIATVSCNKSDDINLENTNSNEVTKLPEFMSDDTTSLNTEDALDEHESLSETLNDILQKQYAWKEFAIAYPQFEIIAQSAIAMNITVPEFENVVFVFSGALDEDISEYKMASVNAPGDVLLPEHSGKTFEKIIEEENERSSYVISDDFMQHLYKYEYIYIYRDDFYYFIRGFRHSNALSSEHIAMFRYDENHKRPW